MDRRYLRANMSVYACSPFLARALLIAFHRGSHSNGKFYRFLLTYIRLLRDLKYFCVQKKHFVQLLNRKYYEKFRLSRIFNGIFLIENLSVQICVLRIIYGQLFYYYYFLIILDEKYIVLIFFSQLVHASIIALKVCLTRNER